VAAAALATTPICVGLLIWPARPTPPYPLVPVIRPAGSPVMARHPDGLIPMARARQHRRYQRMAQAGADGMAVAGGGAAAGLLPQTSQYQSQSQFPTSSLAVQGPR
jgi:hypothetical protein